ncbi:TIGR02452 family protein [uncultured Dokdonia sp.]|uniref:TIGR02452 family protein n=1 Tax=uncultured Dokdonia sp. TaxID=575653 RepID=UPI00260E43CD|nr:TIGR02452 family protein [uncultured Dokdonia sp.]
MQKSLRKITAKETLQYTEQGFYINKHQEKVDIKAIQQQAVERTRFYTTEDLNTIIDTTELNKTFSTQFEVIEETTIQSILRTVSEGYLNPMCLNFASAKNPGGGFFNGAQAQEESIARSSGLYPCQMSAFEFYETHRAMKSCVYTDGMIYSPKVPILRKDNGEVLDAPVVSSIITAAAVNTGVVKRFEIEKVPEIKELMKKRIDKLLCLSASQKHHVLILGAWGCGVFQNDPTMIAQLFFELLTTTYEGVFEKVVFAIYAKNKKFIEAFQREFE